MKHLIPLLTLFFTISTTLAQYYPKSDSIEWEWKKTIDSEHDPLDYFYYHTAFDSEGNWYHFGTCGEYISINDEEIPTGYQVNAYVKKYDDTGFCVDYFLFNLLPVWYNWFTPTDIVTDSNDDIIISFDFQGQVLFNNDTIATTIEEFEYFKSSIIKLSNLGELLFVKNFDKTYQSSCSSICIDQQNNIYATGFYEDTLIIDADTIAAVERREAFLLKTNSEGQINWLRSIGGEGQADEGYSVTIGRNNECYLLAKIDYEFILDEVSIEEGVVLFKFNDFGNLTNHILLSPYITQKDLNGYMKCQPFSLSDYLFVHSGYTSQNIMRVSLELDEVIVDNPDVSHMNNHRYVDIDKNDNILISGSFNDTLHILDTIIIKPGNNYYILSINGFNKFNWLSYTDHMYYINSHENKSYLVSDVSWEFVFGRIKRSINAADKLTKREVILIYPNPSNGTIFINGLKEINYNLELYDIHGRLIYLKNNCSETIIELPEVKSDINLLVIKTSNTLFIQKIILK